MAMTHMKKSATISAVLKVSTGEQILIRSKKPVNSVPATSSVVYSTPVSPKMPDRCTRYTDHYRKHQPYAAGNGLFEHIAQKLSRYQALVGLRRQHYGRQTYDKKFQRQQIARIEEIYGRR